MFAHCRLHQVTTFRCPLLQSDSSFGACVSAYIVVSANSIVSGTAVQKTHACCSHNCIYTGGSAHWER